MEIQLNVDVPVKNRNCWGSCVRCRTNSKRQPELISDWPSLAATCSSHWLAQRLICAAHMAIFRAGKMNFSSGSTQFIFSAPKARKLDRWVKDELSAEKEKLQHIAPFLYRVTSLHYKYARENSTKNLYTFCKKNS